MVITPIQYKICHAVRVSVTFTIIINRLQNITIINGIQQHLISENYNLHLSD
jgi:hypothetical protein